MKKSIELMMTMQFAELAVCNLDAVMKDDSLTDKEYNNIREAHDSIASVRDTIERLTKPQRMVSAEAKESGYGEPEDEKIRQELIKVATLAFRRGDTLFGEKWDYMKWITWLKKQGGLFRLRDTIQTGE